MLVPWLPRKVIDKDPDVPDGGDGSEYGDEHGALAEVEPLDGEADDKDDRQFDQYPVFTSGDHNGVAFVHGRDGQIDAGGENIQQLRIYKPDGGGFHQCTRNQTEADRIQAMKMAVTMITSRDMPHPRPISISSCNGSEFIPAPSAAPVEASNGLV